MAMKSGLPRSLLQWWLTLVAAGGALGLIGLRALEALPRHSLLLDYLGVFALPGLVGTILVGAQPHGGGFGDWRDYVLVPIGSGLFWGTVGLGGVAGYRVVRRWLQRSAP